MLRELHDEYTSHKSAFRSKAGVENLDGVPPSALLVGCTHRRVQQLQLLTTQRYLVWGMPNSSCPVDNRIRLDCIRRVT